MDRDQGAVPGQLPRWNGREPARRPEAVRGTPRPGISRRAGRHPQVFRDGLCVLRRIRSLRRQKRQEHRRGQCAQKGHHEGRFSKALSHARQVCPQEHAGGARRVLSGPEAAARTERLLVLHGRAAGAVPLRDSRQMYELLYRNKAPLSARHLHGHESGHHGGRASHGRRCAAQLRRTAHCARRRKGRGRCG